MKRIVTLLAVLILLALPACQAPAQVVETVAPTAKTYPIEVPTENTYPVEVPTEVPTDAPTEAPTDAPTEAPTAEVPVTIDYAKNFTLEYKDGYKLLTVLTP